MGTGQVTRGVILFAHGARDPRWAEPFERLAALVGDRLGTEQVALAFLELMQPDLDGAADRLAAAGCDAVTVVPVFLGQGSHLRRDLPALVDTLRARLPGLAVTVAAAVGEDDAVLAAIANYAVATQQMAVPPPLP